MSRNSECIIYQHGNKNQPQRYLDQKEAAIDPMERRKSYFITYILKRNCTLDVPFSSRPSQIFTHI